MDNRFFTEPIRNSPYGYPREYWELDEQGQPTQKIITAAVPPSSSRRSRNPRSARGAKQSSLVFDEGLGLSTASQQYHTAHHQCRSQPS